MSKIVVKFTTLKYGDSEAKSIPPKKCFFFETTEKLKIGRGWPKSAGRFLNRFGTSQQKHLTPFYNKTMLLSSILKKYRQPKEGVVISSIGDFDFSRFLQIHVLVDFEMSRDKTQYHVFAY